MIFEQEGAPLRSVELPVPEPAPHQVRVRVEACGLCRTDLHLIDGELDAAKRPVVPGHQIVGTIEKLGDAVARPALGARVGIPWLGSTCGNCGFCTSERENLCDRAQFTGYQLDGGLAEFTVADASYCFPLADDFPAVQAAPLMCAGLIGFRALGLTRQAKRLGLYGFGAAAHIAAQVALYFGQELYAFTRPGDKRGQAFAKELGAHWSGGSDDAPPNALDAAIIFAPVGELVPVALRAVAKGGTVVCAGIHMSDIPTFPYALLWGERSVRSVANLTRNDGVEFLRLATEIPVQTHVTPFALEEANAALDAIRNGTLDGAAVVVI